MGRVSRKRNEGEPRLVTLSKRPDKSFMSPPIEPKDELIRWFQYELQGEAGSIHHRIFNRTCNYPLHYLFLCRDQSTWRKIITKHCTTLGGSSMERFHKKLEKDRDWEKSVTKAQLENRELIRQQRLKTRGQWKN
jgi:hypothetical protein